jgi:hypothetical protein
MTGESGIPPRPKVAASQRPGDAPPGAPAAAPATPLKSGIIELHLREVRQLFNSLDPSPFNERDLDPNAEEYIVESVEEMPTRTPCLLALHLDQPIDSSDEERALGDAIRDYFARRARYLRRQLRELLHRGVVSLGIGIAFLGLLFVIAQFFSRGGTEPGYAPFVRESLLILGWVAMWRPLEIFLYDWWPIVVERRQYIRLSQIHVRVIESARATLTPAAKAKTAEPTAEAISRWEGEGGSPAGMPQAKVRSGD